MSFIIGRGFAEVKILKNNIGLLNRMKLFDKIMHTRRVGM